ncbi:hypothetical protein MVES1_001830 [Malassezia vespertilionis]|uniref:PLD phosphodiesterase domain-containing protein n=1 Tax=Malassezia vespertilionis TaxID=2020962 RepID=A0A2N1JCG1_9BASI|nr:uncharacterized protein MVES1_001830 [Malassezia vespertilionis]PKI84227.1 hypothetical protein MVES_001733 [Malassezia vespertilionis]WFD06485.1 hypothetical protein MVES1_001830 [Malassezia vespertilionis]
MWTDAVVISDDDSPPPAQVQPRSLLDIIPNRAQLEKERLARVEQRNATYHGPSASNAHQTPSDTKKRARSASPPMRSVRAFVEDARYTPIQGSDRFWHGAIKATYNRYAHSSQPGTRLSQLLLPSTASRPSELERVLLTSYDVEIDWLLDIFPRTVPVTYIGNPPRGASANDSSTLSPGFYGADRAPNWEMGIPVKPHARALQHSKLLLLFYKSYLRVVISTGNLTQLDWSRYENVFYIQDFPTPDHAPSLAPPGPKASGGAFRTELEHVLASLSVPAHHPARRTLAHYSFACAAAHIVATQPLSPVLQGWDDMERVGLARLSHVVRMLMPPLDTATLEAQGSSLGIYDRRWLEQFYMVASGINPKHVLPLDKSSGPSPAFVQRFGDRPWPPMQILFPTQSYVQHTSVEGASGGGCFFAKPHEYVKRAWRPIFAQPVSQRGDILMHAKCILAISENNDGWVYVGSANFTRAAWGTIAGTRAKPTLSANNWELGVVLPLCDSGIKGTPMDAVPYRRPVQPYTAADKPWDVQTLSSSVE